MKKSLHKGLVVVGLLAAVGVAYVWQRPGSLPPPAAGKTTDKAAPGAKDGKDAKPAGPVPVEARQVQLRTLSDDTQAVGSLRAHQSVVLKPESAGRIVKLGFQDGQRVRKGQVLIQLDDSLQAAQLQQAEAQAHIARTQLQRNKELLSQGFVTPSALDQAQATLDVAEAQVALARAQLARMRVLAPFDGVAGIRTVSLGDYVKDGAELVSLEDSSTVWVDFRLPEREAPRVRPGQALQLSLDALPGKQFDARVQALDAQLDANGRSLLVRAQVLKPGPELRSGLFARVRLSLGERQQAVVVPEEALVPMGGKQYLIKLVPAPEGQGQVAQRFEAKLGLRVPGLVEITEGLKPGDWVVTAGQAKLMRGDGQPVKRVDVDQQGAKPAAASTPASTPASAPSKG